MAEYGKDLVGKRVYYALANGSPEYTGEITEVTITGKTPHVTLRDNKGNTVAYTHESFEYIRVADGQQDVSVIPDTAPEDDDKQDKHPALAD